MKKNKDEEEEEEKKKEKRRRVCMHKTWGIIAITPRDLYHDH